jgi:hypothetical protein
MHARGHPDAPPSPPPPSGSHPHPARAHPISTPTPTTPPWQVSGWHGAKALHAATPGAVGGAVEATGVVAYNGMMDCFIRTTREEGALALFKVRPGGEGGREIGNGGKRDGSVAVDEPQSSAEPGPNGPAAMTVQPMDTTEPRPAALQPGGALPARRAWACTG